MDTTSPQVVQPDQGAPQDAENSKRGSNTNEQQQQQQQQQQPPATFLQLQQLQQQQQNAQPNAATVGGLPFALTGASPLQQQLSALAGLTAAPPTMAAQPPLSQGLLHSNNQPLLQGLNPQLLQQLGLTTQAPQPNPQLLAGQQQLLGTATATQHQTSSSDPQQLLDTAANQILGNPQQQQQQQRQLPQVAPQQQAGLNNIQQLQLMLMMNPQMLQGGAGANLLALMGQPQPPQQPQLFQVPGLAQLAQPGLAPQAPVNMHSLLQAAAAPNRLGSLLQNTGSTNAFKPSATVAPPPKPSSEIEWSEPFAGKGKKEPPFPLKLHQILSNPEFAECICWNSHGRSWRILKPPVFEQVVIPLYFRHAKYASFMRQVNGWGFKRIVSGNDHNSYYHELFQRDSPELCIKMKRIKKGESLKAKKELGAIVDGGKDELGSNDQYEDAPDVQDQMNAQPAPSSTPQLQNPAALQAALQNLQKGAPGLSGLAGLNTANIAGLRAGVSSAPRAPLDAQSALAGLIGSAGAAAAPQQQQQLDLGVGALNMAAPGLSALAGLSQAATASKNPILSTALAGGQPQQQTEQKASSSTPPAPPVAAAAPTPPLGGIAGLDSALLAKLLQQTQQPNASMPTPRLELLASQIGGGQNASSALAAQLQAATQPPPPASANDGGDEDSSEKDKDDSDGPKEKE